MRVPIVSDLVTALSTKLRPTPPLATIGWDIHGGFEKAAEVPGSRAVQSGVLGWGGYMVANGLLVPNVDPVLLVHAYASNWMIHAAVNKHVDLAIKNGYRFRPRFVLKCQHELEDGEICGMEYDHIVPQCEACETSKDLVEPDPEQLRKIQRVFRKPNADAAGRVKKSIEALLTDWALYNKVVASWYAEIILDEETGDPLYIYSLPAESMRRVQEGKGFKFCRTCIDRELFDPAVADKDRILSRYMYRIDETRCRVCKQGNLKVAAWVRVHEGTSASSRGAPVMAWTEEDVAPGASKNFGSRIYGMPSISCVYAMAQVLSWQEKYQWASYALNKMPKGALHFPETPNKEVQAMFSEYAAWKERHPEVPDYLVLGGGKQPPTWVSFMLNFQQLQSREMADYFREAIAVVFGVSLAMLGIQTAGKLGKETEVVEVSYESIEVTQRELETFVNEQVLPRWRRPIEEGDVDADKQPDQLVTDWVFELNKPKRDDLQRKAGLQQQAFNNLQVLHKLGGKGHLSEDGTELIIDELDPEVVAENFKQMQAQEEAGKAAQEGRPQPGSLAERLKGLKQGQSVDVNVNEAKQQEEREGG